ncbi:bifunctional diguanylate cyclase/phosphodiesterase [Variovorax sp. YR752]|uniref:putative bifunctional diguanylate cyclase/phosphodiesterase n=1 Tax=Variovorax sp. YR752 TaxID=1884383 RepID=UPI0031377F45
MLPELTAGSLTAIAGAVLALGGAAAWALRARRAGAKAPAAAAQDTGQDSLTGLPSRVRFELMLQDGLTASERTGSDSCVLYLGVDGMRLVNERFGHPLGDRTLATVAARLRELCGPAMPLGRIGGDEFALWLNAPRDAGEKLANRLADAFAAPMTVDGRELAITLSVGLAVAPDHGGNLRLLNKAAAAMQSVKRSGGGSYAVFDPRIEAAHGEEATIARELQQAVVKRQLELFYQPRLDAATLQVSAVEALLRWRHPTLGLVSPARFIPIAERHGLIDSIGGWALDAALKQAGSWRAAGLKLRVAVNVSGRQFRQDDFAAKLERALKAHGLPADAVVCEIAEDAAIENTEATRRAFDKLHQLGVGIAIDDFGASAAAIAALHGVPAQELKLDRALLAHIARQPEARLAFANAVQAARSLKLRLVAQGIEAEPQRALAAQLGCDELQGYLFAKPMSARAVAIWAADAATTLAQTFKPSAFKDTLPMEGQRAPEGFAQTRISLRR